MRCASRGFSLVELLVVVAIIAVLAAAAIPQYKYMLARAMRTEAIVTLESVRLGQSGWFAANGEYLPEGCTITSCASGCMIGTPALISDINRRLGLEPTDITPHGWKFMNAAGWGYRTWGTAAAKTNQYTVTISKDIDHNLLEGYGKNADVWLLQVVNNCGSLYPTMPVGRPALYFDDILNHFN